MNIIKFLIFSLLISITPIFAFPHLSDSNLQQKLIGTWNDNEGFPKECQISGGTNLRAHHIITMNAKLSCFKTIHSTLDVSGYWTVEDGILIEKVKKADDKSNNPMFLTFLKSAFHQGMVTKDKILYIDNKKLTLKSLDDGDVYSETKIK